MKTTHILTIDDERVICDACHLVLSEKGYSVDIRMTGNDGLKAIKKGNYDVVLLDMKLPDMEGMEILQILRKENPDLYVIVMTGYSTVSNAVEAMKLGAFDYLSKPFPEDELSISVKKAVENKRLKEENLSLRTQLYERFDFNNIIGENPKILRIFDQIKRVAPTDSTVLIGGESGTGKELFARAIHTHSQRAVRKFVALDCSTLSTGLLESELFGHVKGAFTGAIHNKAGIFEVAHEGTLFLDEVANLRSEIQGKLLRVMETHEYKPVGASAEKKTDVRVIAATNRELKRLVEEGSFRDDLFYRFNVFPIYLPPLRERKDDIPKLAYHFLKFFCKEMGKRIEGFSDDAMELLVKQGWPGNVRQLKNVVERLVIMADENILDMVNMMDFLRMKKTAHETSVPETLKDLHGFKKQILKDHYRQTEKAFLMKALKDCDGNISRAARKVGMQRSNFHALMKNHHLSVKDIHVKRPALKRGACR
jgi:DNA-binding NtrC family response regulator